MAVALAGRGDLKAARAVADEITTPPMQGEARKAIVVALLRAKDLAAASKAADAVADDAGRCFALMELAKGFAAASRRDEAKRVLDAATDLADRLESPKGTRGVREAALAFAAGARAAAGDVDAALAWAKKHEDASVRTMAQVRIAEALAPRR